MEQSYRGCFSRSQSKHILLSYSPWNSPIVVASRAHSQSTSYCLTVNGTVLSWLLFALTVKAHLVVLQSMEQSYLGCFSRSQSKHILLSYSPWNSPIVVASRAHSQSTYCCLTVHGTVLSWLLLALTVKAHPIVSQSMEQSYLGCFSRSQSKHILLSYSPWNSPILVAFRAHSQSTYCCLTVHGTVLSWLLLALTVKAHPVVSQSMEQSYLGCFSRSQSKHILLSHSPWNSPIVVASSAHSQSTSCCLTVHGTVLSWLLLALTVKAHPVVSQSMEQSYRGCFSRSQSKHILLSHSPWNSPIVVASSAHSQSTSCCLTVHGTVLSWLLLALTVKAHPVVSQSMEQSYRGCF